MSVFPSSRLFACLPACIHVCFPVCLSMCLLACLFVYLHAFLSAFLSVCFRVYLSICLSVDLCRSICLFAYSVCFETYQQVPLPPPHRKTLYPFISTVLFLRRRGPIYRRQPYMIMITLSPQSPVFSSYLSIFFGAFIYIVTRKWINNICEVNCSSFAWYSHSISRFFSTHFSAVSCRLSQWSTIAQQVCRSVQSLLSQRRRTVVLRACFPDVWSRQERFYRLQGETITASS